MILCEIIDGRVKGMTYDVAIISWAASKQAFVVRDAGISGTLGSLDAFGLGHGSPKCCGSGDSSDDGVELHFGLNGLNVNVWRRCWLLM